MASILKVNELQGIASAGSISVTGEGNSTTTNLQQGLAKTWANLNGTSTIALRDNFNVSSATDNGTGNYTINLTNATSNANYAVTTSGYQDNSLYSLVVSVHEATAPTTTTYKLICQQMNTTTAYDCARVHSSVLGDLA